MAVRPYNSSVLVGNWNEDCFLEEEEIKKFLHKKENGLLQIQKSDEISTYLMKPTILSVAVDGYIHYGSDVMLVGDGNCSVMLTPTPDECDVTGSTAISAASPVARNTWTIVPLKEGRTTPVLYGESFLLQCQAAPEDYLRSDYATFTNGSKHARHQAVTVDSPVTYCSHWKFLHKNPQHRIESEGSPVEANTPLIINHVKTNENLAVESAHKYKTNFGPEYEVSSHTYLDSHKAEQPPNIFCVAMGTPADNTKVTQVTQ